MPVRVGVADSGINPSYAGAQPVEPGVGIRVEADTAATDGHWQDELGHGTAVAATIRGYSPDAQLFPIRIFRKRLIAPVTALVGAIDWAAENNLHLLNLSLGVTKLQWRETFEAAVARASDAGVVLVSAAETESTPCLPGLLPGVVGVRASVDLGQGEFALDPGTQDVVLSSSWARELPRLAKHRNLAGASAAVAHVTGALAHWFAEVGPQPERACLKFFERQSSAAE